MSTGVLLLAVTLLALVRGFFLAFPRVPVRSIWLKLCLLGVVAVISSYAWWSEYPGNVAPPLRVAPLLLAAALIGIILLPRGTLNEQQKKGVVEMLDTLVVAGATALLIIGFVVRPFFIPSESMKPTLQVDDMVLVNELCYRLWNPARNDIIVFRPPPEAHMDGKDLIKRVIAVGGDTLAIRHGQTYVNAKPVPNPFVNQEPLLEISADFGPVKVPPGRLFCMGDNRNNSDDSRYWGTLPVESVIGRAICIFWPPTRIGRAR